MSPTLGYFIDRKSLKEIFHTIFESHLNYFLLFWAKSSNAIKRLVLQKKSLRLICIFSLPLCPYASSSILKLSDKIFDLKNSKICPVINKYFQKTYPQSLKIGSRWFSYKKYSLLKSKLLCETPHTAKLYRRNYRKKFIRKVFLIKTKIK